MSDIVERLRAGTAGLTLFEIEALWGEAATALSAVVERRKTTGDRFFIDHGQIHDRATGKHVTTDEDSVFCDGINSALELLNTLNAAATEAADAITTLRALLESVDEKALEVAAKALHEAEDSSRSWDGLVARPDPAWANDTRDKASAAISAYLAALKERVKP